MFLKPVALWIRRNKILPDILTYRTLIQLSRYMVSGIIAFLTEYIIFTILLYLSTHNIILSNVISMSTGFVISFLLNRHWSFKSKSNPYIQIFMLFFLFIINLFISTETIFYLSHLFGLTPFISKIMMMIFIALWNFIIYKKFIFR